MRKAKHPDACHKESWHHYSSRIHSKQTHAARVRGIQMIPFKIRPAARRRSPNHVHVTVDTTRQPYGACRRTSVSAVCLLVTGPEQPGGVHERSYGIMPATSPQISGTNSLSLTQHHHSCQSTPQCWCCCRTSTPKQGIPWCKSPAIGVR